MRCRHKLLNAFKACDTYTAGKKKPAIKQAEVRELIRPLHIKNYVT